MPKLTVFAPSPQTYTVPVGVNLMNQLRILGYPVDAPCGGNGKCKKCCVYAEGDLSSITESEKELPAGQRLLCSTSILGDAVVMFPIDSSAIVETSGKVLVQNLIDQRNGYAAAVDIGTTTVVVSIENLLDGNTIGVSGKRNVQRAYGADVISRIDASRNRHFFTELHKCIVLQIEEMIVEEMKQKMIPLNQLQFVVIAGNNTMELLFAGISPSPLSEYPFISPDLFGHDIASPFTKVFPERIYLLPSIESFVGGDIVAAIMASGMYKNDALSLLLDIGTNGEMVLGNKQGMSCCATAAGPAFEGADISCGMPGLSGAVDKVYIEDDSIHFHVISDCSPIGICGSGLVDLLAVLLCIGAVDDTGRLLPPDEAPASISSLLEKTNKGVVFHLPGCSLSITEGDIRKLQLAKAAIRAGIETLLHEKRVSIIDVETLYLAGGFGCHINSISAAIIGMIPSELTNKVIQIGNGSCKGASLIAKSSFYEKTVTEITNLCQYIDLSSNKFWNEQYIENMMFEQE